MGIESMQSSEGRAEITNEINAATLASLREQVRIKATEAAAIAQRISNEALSQEELDALGTQLRAIVEEGSKLKSELEKLEARSA